jgi:hypothetical protein
MRKDAFGGARCRMNLPGCHALFFVFVTLPSRNFPVKERGTSFQVKLLMTMHSKLTVNASTLHCCNIRVHAPYN